MLLSDYSENQKYTTTNKYGLTKKNCLFACLFINKHHGLLSLRVVLDIVRGFVYGVSRVHHRSTMDVSYDFFVYLIFYFDHRIMF